MRFLKVDNNFVIALIKNLILHEQSKHIEVKYHPVRESTEMARSRWSSSGAKSIYIGDILTKPLGRVKFLELHAKISLIDVGRHNMA
jgi:hypothetical protein